MMIPTVAANPVILMLKNIVTKKYHPILFWECPPPSGNLGDGLRWKSKGHHTTGFTDRDEAVKGAMDLVKQSHDMLVIGSVYYQLGEENDAVWDNTEMPAAVQTFALSQLTKYEPESKEA